MEDCASVVQLNGEIVDVVGFSCSCPTDFGVVKLECDEMSHVELP